MSTNSSSSGKEPDDEPDDVLFNTMYGVRTIELNRPKKLNSLNGSMARKIIPRLKVHKDYILLPDNDILAVVRYADSVSFRTVGMGEIPTRLRHNYCWNW